jgi:hypothetical protein
MLGRLKMDVQECIDVHNSMFEEIFGSPVHKFKVTLAFQIQSQFDSEILRRCILRIIAKSQNLAGDDKKACSQTEPYSQLSYRRISIRTAGNLNSSG